MVSLCLLLFWMGVIFYLSAQTSAVSSNTSGRVITFLLKHFYPSFDTLSRLKRAALIENYQFFVRKAAHVFLYAMLGVFSFFTAITYRSLKLKYRVAIAGAICVVYSALDEWHQTIVSGRSGEIRDVLIDSTGAATAILCLLLICVCIKPIYRSVRVIEE